MHYELITAEEFDQLPEDPEEQFIELEGICRRSMTRMIDDNTRAEFDHLVRMQYMTTVAAAAQELGIDGIKYPYDAEHPANELDDFLLRVSGVVTRIRLRSGNRIRPYSVRLGTRSKGRIEIEIRKLRGWIEEADLPGVKRKALLAKLDELAAELNHTRVSFAKIMRILAAISVPLASGTAFLAEAPAAIHTILTVIGSDKEREDEEAARLAPPPKALPAPQPKQEPKRPMPVAFETDFDNDVPF